MTWPTQEGDDEAMDGSITRTGGWMEGASSAAPPGSFETDAAVAQSTWKDSIWNFSCEANLYISLITIYQ